MFIITRRLTRTCSHALVVPWVVMRLDAEMRVRSHFSPLFCRLEVVARLRSLGRNISQRDEGRSWVRFVRYVIESDVGRRKFFF
jgi:hypothetical protein